MRHRSALTAVVALLAVLFALPAAALDDAHWKQANQSIQKGIDYLRTTQNEDGSWSPKPGPAITAMVVRVMLERKDISPNDPAVEKAINYIMSKVKDDGGIHDGFLENYNTAICLSALSLVKNRPDAALAVQKAQDYLKGLQWVNQTDPKGNVVDQNHAYYGGAGYGSHGRPDMSNTQIMLEGLYDSGLSCDDPAFQRALTFISRCQGIESNEFLKGKAVMDGGFIYATSIDKDAIGVPQSQGSPEMSDEGSQGRPVSGLRTYGSMTYAGFKSYIYANLDRDDPRVQGAYKWIQSNYTLDRNPGMPDAQAKQGLYYYFMTFSRALDAWGLNSIPTDGGDRDWANDLVSKLASLQAKDGSWKNDADRWMESDANLVTAYALIALQHATN